jgi:NADPH:quinone reductase-like Zn-dependent oxidoreductase
MPELLVRRDDLQVCRLVDDPPPATVADGEALLRVERFALTTNTISYAVLGDALRYWEPFPADGPWGRIPAWGHARVIASRSPAAAEGDRVFGLVPMGTHLVVRPVQRGLGFADAVPHRAALSPVYNQYLPVAAGESDAALVMRPLFGTAVVLDLVLARDGLGSADTVVVTSASSKTAYGLAHLLRARQLTVIGLTSPSRRAWLRRQGLYDVVLGYDELDRIAPGDGAVLVDVAGDDELLPALHRQLGSALRRSILVGFTHGQVRPDASLRGPEPEFFFAPDAMIRFGRELGRRYAEAWQGFAPQVDQLMRVVVVSTGEELRRTYLDLLAGRIDPAVGHVVALD